MWLKNWVINAVCRTRWDCHQHTRKGFTPRSLSRGSPIASLEKPTWWWLEKEFWVQKTSICERCRASVLVPPPWEGCSRQQMTLNQPAWSSGCCNRGSTTLTRRLGEIIETYMNPVTGSVYFNLWFESIGFCVFTSYLAGVWEAIKYFKCFGLSAKEKPWDIPFYIPWRRYGQGRSERVLGMALKEVPRKSYYLATKVKASQILGPLRIVSQKNSRLSFINHQIIKLLIIKSSN